MPTCDIHDECREQGCLSDPEHCQRAQDIRARARGNADTAAKARMNKFDRNTMPALDDRVRRDLQAQLDREFVEYQRRVRPIIQALVDLAKLDPPPPIVVSMDEARLMRLLPTDIVSLEDDGSAEPETKKGF